LDILDEQPDERIYREVQREPEFPGDKEQWLVKNIRLPKAANGERLSGRVIVCLVVNEDGSVSGVRVRQGINKTLNDEALRVVRSMPHWKPALKDGKPVKCLITIWVPFKGI
jgi:protein TonB